MILAAASSSSTQALWYLTRGSGIVSFLLLTVTMVVGILEWRRWTPSGWPRFVVDALHRDLALVAIAFLSVHVVTSILDGFAPISLLDAVVPFGGTYRPFWLGLGALSLDLMVAVALTSLLRAQIGLRAWRAVHWTAYASWPVALLHSVGTGSDVKAGWMLASCGVSLFVVVAAVAARALDGWPRQRAIRTAALVTCAVVPAGMVAWMPSGPLGPGWARRAGTPASLLAFGAAPGTASVRAVRPRLTKADRAYRGTVTGTLAQSQEPGSGVAIQLALRLDDALHRRLAVTLSGQPLHSGGITLSSSTVDLGPAQAPREYSGTVTALSGPEIRAVLRRADGRGLAMDLIVQTDQSSNTVRGTIALGPTVIGA